MKYNFDLIVIGAGSAGLGAALAAAKVGLKVLQIVKTDHQIGGDCLNEGCVPSKALIYVAKQIHQAKAAKRFGLEVSGEINIDMVTAYIREAQQKIRVHENVEWLKKQGVTVVLGEAAFQSKNAVMVNDTVFTSKFLVIATGSRPEKLKVPGVELVQYFDNESVFHLKNLPKKFLVIGAGPVGIEMGQALHRLGSEVTFVQKGDRILPHDDPAITSVLMERLKAEGVKFILNAKVDHFISIKEALLKMDDGTNLSVEMDAIFVAIGRNIKPENLKPEKAGIALKDGKIKSDQYLRTTNKSVFVAGDAAGSLLFSHAAEQHVRLLMNNFFSPLKQKLDNDKMSWVTFSDPQVASFGLNEKQLSDRKIAYEQLEMDFKNDDRAATDDYQYGKMVLLISKNSLIGKKIILGGSMVAPSAGEMVQELILANYAELNVTEILNKIYPYPVASRVNQQILSEYFENQLTPWMKKGARFMYGKFV